MRKSFMISLVASGLVAGPAFAATLVDGDFEAVSGSYRNSIADGDPAASGVPGWSHSGTMANGALDIYESDDQTDGLAAQSGTHYVSFGHNGTAGGSLFQSFATAPGASYTVNYYVAEQQGDDSGQILRAILTNGSQTLSADNTGLTLSFLPGAPITFAALTNFATISFFDATADGGGPSNLALDSVSVTDNAPIAAVPEPATWGMMIAGFSIMGFMMRRRQKVATTRGTYA